MMPSKKRARSNEDKEIQFKKILSVGTELLQKGKGFSMRELARRLMMSPGNLYNYVKSENELRVAILNEHLIMSEDDFEEYLSKSDIAYIEMLENLIEHFFESNKKHGWVSLELMSLPDLNESNSIDLALLINPYKRIIEKAIKAGELPVQNIELSALYVWSALQGAVNVLRLGESSKLIQGFSENEFQECITRMIISSLKTIS